MMTTVTMIMTPTLTVVAVVVAVVVVIIRVVGSNDASLGRNSLIGNSAHPTISFLLEQLQQQPQQRPTYQQHSHNTATTPRNSNVDQFLHREKEGSDENMQKLNHVLQS
jgi:hypothetical protein